MAHTDTRQSNTPVLDTLAAMTEYSVEHCNLAPREMMIARIAALAAVDAPATSYLLNVGAAAEVGITIDDVQGVLAAVAPVVGTPGIMAAGGNILKALGFAVTVADQELLDQSE